MATRRNAPVRAFLFGLLGLLGLFAASLVGAPVMADSLQGVHVTGRGEVAVVPDMMRLTLQVSAQHADALALKTQIDEVTRAVLKLTDKLNIARKDVTAAVVNVQPNIRYEKNRQVIEGMRGSRTIAVVLRDLDDFGELLNGALERGVNSISGVQLDTSRRAELEDQALDAAIADARARAAHVAQQFGVVLGPVVDVHVAVQRPQPRMMAMRAEAASADDFSGGELDVTRDVQAVFAIEAATEQAASQ